MQSPTLIQAELSHLFPKAFKSQVSQSHPRFTAFYWIFYIGCFPLWRERGVTGLDLLNQHHPSVDIIPSVMGITTASLPQASAESKVCLGLYLLSCIIFCFPWS